MPMSECLESESFFRHRLQWYRARVGAMSLREVGYRIIEHGRRAAWRRDRAGWDNFLQIEDGLVSDWDFLRSRLANANGATVGAKFVDSVRRTCDGDVELLGRCWSVLDRDKWRRGCPPGEFWLGDPVSGKTWPGADIYCFAIEYRRAMERGDIKYVCELNRLQFLHPIAAKIARTGDVSLIRWAFRLLASWAHANPPFRGINWISGIELALRLVSLALLIAAAGPTQLEVGERILVRRVVAAHGYWLYRYPSRFSSANNHLLLEGLGLYIAGTLAPDLPGAKRWAHRGRNILEKEVSKQILEDGVGAEQSPTYQSFIMEALAFAIVLASGIGTPLDPSVLDRLAVGAKHLLWLLDDGGVAPAIGDNDETRVIAQPPDREPRYIASIVAAVAGITGRPTLAPGDWDPHLRDVLFDTPKAARGRCDGICTFPVGGYTAIRDRIGGHRCHLIFDHGPLGYLSLSAHGHADALALWLTVDDQPVFIDAGTYLYYSAGSIRGQLRESAAHNTLLVAGVSQSRASGAFTWANKATGRLLSWCPWPNWSVTGEHDGYLRSFGVRHVRTIERGEPGIIIRDHLDGADRPLPVAIRFLLHPGLVAVVEDREIAIYQGQKLLASVLAPPNYRIDAVNDASAGDGGWYSPRFGELVPAPVIALSGEMSSREEVTYFKLPPLVAR
jgi:hypothetical protein